jgi:hypothetical protein
MPVGHFFLVLAHVYLNLCLALPPTTPKPGPLWHYKRPARSAMQTFDHDPENSVGPASAHTFWPSPASVTRPGPILVSPLPILRHGLHTGIQDPKFRPRRTCGPCRSLSPGEMQGTCIRPKTLRGRIRSRERCTLCPIIASSRSLISPCPRTEVEVLLDLATRHTRQLR